MGTLLATYSIFLLIAIMTLIALRSGGFEREIIKKIVITFGVCLFLELIVFNYNAITTSRLSEYDLTENISQSATENKAEILVPHISTETLYLRFTGDIGYVTNVSVFLKDDAYANAYTEAASFKVIPDDDNYNSDNVILKSKGNLRNFKITWDNPGVSLSNAILNKPLAYHFTLTRFLTIFLISALLISLMSDSLWSIMFDPKSRKQRIAFVLVVCTLIVSVVWVKELLVATNVDEWGITTIPEYPITNEAENDFHVYQFDSLMNHTSGIVRKEVSPQLLELENPYDPSQREGLDYLWDFALYNGHYYTYYGMTPVLVFYVPYYFATGHLPSYATASFFFALLTVIFGSMCTWKAAELFAPKTKAIGVFIATPAVALGSNVLCLLSAADKYTLNYSSMLTFVFLTVWAAFVALSSRKIWIKSVFFLISGISTVLLLESRSSGSLHVAGLLIPLFLMILVSKEYTIKNKANFALSYIIPLVIGAALIIRFNMIRFGSPLEFGQNYQLTVSDIHYNKVNLAHLPAALYYYFFDYLEFKLEFPFISVGSHFVNHTGNMFYDSASFGIFVFPITWPSLLLTRRMPEDNRNLMAFRIAMFVAIVVALMDFDIGGLNYRYPVDILPITVLAGGVAVMKYMECNHMENKILVASIAIMTTTILLAVLLIFILHGVNYICEINPRMYLKYFRMWRL
ncbi:hypothetical protein [Butyrivibrio sp. XPD2006]|uniref:hypothetical protein n=1 Tax=Butyrivibrio sp. XPD2006 TaxID=1280668 RepID=UPI0003B706AE|nr:hypothetical protein [Butyrivibrio sp. XPD2006]